MTEVSDGWDDDLDGGDLDAGVVVSALTVDVPLVPVPAAQVLAGSPASGSVDLDEDMGIGVWEMTVGAMRDVEIDEVFVVLAGDATVEFTSPTLPPITLTPGAVVRLAAGMQTVWTVRETLRKVYLV
ncbi:cupin domain-containing protein [Microbacterium flavum]|uniref:Cupin domain-containing protein n=1 Tax=Microbacterium flavum TaxID=415216 RepID=A0ABS5XQ47_9MICO|nr:cupin domain-containing protein [Microbacterium flavum]MBT8796647.1 cupin domain-containing protein [Microbacterium flavum]